MIDKDTLSAGAQAVKIAQLEGGLNLLQQSLKNSVDNMNSTLSSTQAETRALVDAVRNLTSSQVNSEHDRRAIAKLDQDFTSFRLELKGMFDRQVENHDAKLRANERARDEWRDRHEAENEDAQRETNIRLRQIEVDANAKIQEVSDAVRTMRATAIGASLLVGAVVAISIYVIELRFNQGTEQLQTQQRAVEYNRVQIDAEKENRQRIELYLARGGINPQAPYTKEGAKP